MGKKEDYRLLLRPYLADEDRSKELEELLQKKSNLPGPRGNIELAQAFGDCFAEIDIERYQWGMLRDWLDYAPSQAPTGNPQEFLPFCALQALGASYINANEQNQHFILQVLQNSSADSRWRIREGVAMAFQRIGEQDFKVVQEIFSYWIEDAFPLEQRAIIASLAHPPYLKTAEHGEFALDITDYILEGIVKLDGNIRRSEDFKILRQGLEYAISVFVAYLPEKGFAFLEKWAKVSDKDLKKIIKSNLTKKRLINKYPEEVEKINSLL